MTPEIAHQFTRLFNTEAGKQVLEHLKSITLHRVLSAGSSDAELRFLEGQRCLVHQIEMLIKQGREQH